MKSIINFWMGFITGALICAAAVMLFTPASGEELRRQLNDRAGKIQDELNQAASQRRSELQAQLDSLRKPRQVA
jgi:gas vesicle protein